MTNTHPTLSLARTMMYIFILFAAFWNLRANGYLYRHDPVFDDPLSDHFCYPAVYWLTFVLVLAFDLVFGAALFIWVSAILAGMRFLETNSAIALQSGPSEGMSLGVLRVQIAAVGAD